MDQPELSGLVPDHLRPRGIKIMVDSLEVTADIGFHDFEVGKPQRLLVSIEVWLDESSFPAGDDPAAVWDYDHLRGQVIELAAKGRYNLQETLALAIYDRIAAMHGVAALRVTTVKPDVYPDTKGVGVQLASFRRQPRGF